MVPPSAAIAAYAVCLHSDMRRKLLNRLRNYPAKNDANLSCRINISFNYQISDSFSLRLTMIVTVQLSAIRNSCGRSADAIVHTVLRSIVRVFTLFFSQQLPLRLIKQMVKKRSRVPESVTKCSWISKVRERQSFLLLCIRNDTSRVTYCNLT